jgi:hypothetical protein
LRRLTVKTYASNVASGYAADQGDAGGVMVLLTGEPGPSRGAEGTAAGSRQGPGRRIGFEPPGGGRGPLDATSGLGRAGNR